MAGSVLLACSRSALDADVPQDAAVVHHHDASIDVAEEPAEQLDAQTPDVHDAPHDVAPEVETGPPPPLCPPATSPTVLATFTGGCGSRLTADNNYVYFTYDDWSKRHVGRVSKCGGAIDVLSWNDIGADGVFVYKSVLYYLGVEYPGRLREIQLPSGPPQTIASLSGQPGPNLATDGTGDIYFGYTFTNDQIVYWSGGPLNWLAFGSGALALDATNVYTTAATNNGFRVASVARSGGAVTGLGDAAAYTIAIDATDVFYSNWLKGNDGFIKSVPKTGGTITTLATQLAMPTGLAVDATDVYFCNEGNGFGIGTVAKVPKGGGTVTTLATAQDQPEAIIDDAWSVYWINNGGQLMKIDK